MGEGDAEGKHQRRRQNLCIMGELQSTWFVRRRTEKVREGIRAEQEAVRCGGSRCSRRQASRSMRQQCRGSS